MSKGMITPIGRSFNEWFAVVFYRSGGSDSEIRQFDHSLFADQQIGSFDVPMNDPLWMQIDESIEYLFDVDGSELLWEEAIVSKNLCQRSTIDKLQHQVQMIGCDDQLDISDDVPVFKVL